MIARIRHVAVHPTLRQVFEWEGHVLPHGRLWLLQDEARQGGRHNPLHERREAAEDPARVTGSVGRPPRIRLLREWSNKWSVFNWTFKKDPANP